MVKRKLAAASSTTTTPLKHKKKMDVLSYSDDDDNDNESNDEMEQQLFNDNSDSDDENEKMSDLDSDDDENDENLMMDALKSYDENSDNEIDSDDDETISGSTNNNNSEDDNNSNSSSSDSSDSSDSDSSDSDDDEDEPSYAFTITEDISDDVVDARVEHDTKKSSGGDDEDDDDDENNNGDDDDQEEEAWFDRIVSNAPGAASAVTTTVENGDDASSSLLINRNKIDLSKMEIKEPKFVRPFDYEQLRMEQASRGVIFVQKPFGMDLINRFSSPEAIRRFFIEFGSITRVAPEYEFRNRKKHLVGFYVEYEDKNTAKRVALSVNGAPISRRDSRTLSVKYVPKFDWASIGEHEERKKLYQKMLRLEAEKELRLVKGYKRNVKMAERQKDNPEQQFKKTNFKFKQHRFDKYTMDKNHHLNFLPIFGQDSANQNKK